MPSIAVNGEAVVTVEPDQAEIDIGVVTQSRTAVDAAGENASKVSQVIAELKKVAGPQGEIKTAGYALTPNYRYPKEGGKPEIVGYTATNIVRAKTSNLAVVGKLIDAAMRAGANRVQRLAFMLKDEQAAQRQALREATLKAKAKADEIARALGVKIVRVRSVTESGQVVRPMMQDAVALRAEAAAQTPIEAGTIEVRASVVLTAEIAGP
ncbi:MAG TPA: SIMPL domain-containing protein [Candidatus Acidoferrales bacterium]|nr:SIMPL domain-containing protein [Candidatus Acidoferrales bacterium]